MTLTFLMSIYDDHTEVNQFSFIFPTMNEKRLCTTDINIDISNIVGTGGANFWKQPTKVSFERCTRNQSTVPVSS